MQDFVGDQIFAIFNKRGDQPDHALRAARAALELQRRAETIRVDHPEWPRFRAGINTGPVLAGVVGDRGHRIHGVFGDTVNLGARLEGQAPPGGVVIGGATLAGAARRRRGRARCRSCTSRASRSRSPAYVLRAL